jgi:hypothetical protein
MDFIEHGAKKAKCLFAASTPKITLVLSYRSCNPQVMRARDRLAKQIVNVGHEARSYFGVASMAWLGIPFWFSALKGACLYRLEGVSYQSFVIVRYLDLLAFPFGMTRFSWLQLMCASPPFPYRL